MDWEPRVGMRVVFVGYPGSAVMFHGKRKIKREAFVEFGHVYEILGVEIRKHYSKGKWAGPSLYVGFEDIICGSVWHHWSGFRPLDERRLDVFREMLAPTPKQTVRSDA